MESIKLKPSSFVIGDTFRLQGLLEQSQVVGVTFLIKNQVPGAALLISGHPAKRYHFPMLRKSEKNALSSLFLLCIGAPLALDRFYESGPGDGLLGILGFIISLVTILGLIVWGSWYSRRCFASLRISVAKVSERPRHRQHLDLATSRESRADSKPVPGSLAGAVSMG
jgi:hypothetical protein